MKLKKYKDFILESKQTTIQDIVFKYYQDVYPYYNIEVNMRHVFTDAYSIQHKKSCLEIITNEGFFNITIKKSDYNDAIFGSPKALKLMDEKGYKIKSQEIIDHIYKALFDYIEFIKLNKGIKIGDQIAKALTGNTEYEKILFGAVYKSQHIKWNKFSKELIDTLTEEELNLMKSFKSINKFNLFENNSNLGNLLGYTKDRSILYKKIEELNSASKGWNHYASKSETSNGLGDTKTYYEWNLYYTPNSDKFIIYDDNKIERLDIYNTISDNVSNYDIDKLTNSINSVYEYVFKPEKRNNLQAIIKEYFQHDFIKYDTMWSDLFKRLISEKKFNLIGIINWDESKLSSDQIKNLLKSSKSISKFNL